MLNELTAFFNHYNLQGAELVLSLESPEMCQKVDANHQKVGSEFWLSDMIGHFQDLSDEGEKSAVMAINEDSLLVQGTYKLRFKLKFPSIQPQIREICKTVVGNECILAEEDVTFLTHFLANGTRKEGIINPDLLPVASRPVAPTLKIDPIDNGPSYARSHVGYHILRSGSDVFDVDVKLSDIDTAMCNLVWDLRCLDYKKSLLEFSHQSLDTGVYSVIAKFSNPQHIRELNVTTERRFAALHLQYATFAHLTDKPQILDAWGRPQTNASQQPQYLLTGMSHMGFYFNPDQSLPNPPLQPVPNTLPVHNPAVQVGSEIVYDALSKLKQSPNTFLSGGYFAEGIQNTLVELSKPHAEGMNQAYDAFRLVNFDSANPKRYMQIGFVANLHNRYTANNNLLYNGSSQPVYLEVVDTATGKIRARFPRFVQLGTQTYASVYWDGQPQNLTPEEEDNLPDDAALDADGAPHYMAGEYTIRLSLPPDEEQALVTQPHLEFNFNSRSNRPVTDVTWPTLSPVSSDVQVKITQEEIIEEISPQQLELLQILLEETRQTKEVLNSINLNDQYAFTYSPDFGIAQVPNPGSGFGVALLDNDSKLQMSKAVTDSRFDVDLFERQLNEYIRTRKNTDRQKLKNTASQFSKYSDDVIKYARKYLLNDKTVISGLRLSAVGAFGTVLTAMPQAALNEGMRFARATIPVGNALPDELAAKLTSKLKTQECKNLSNPNVKMNVINAIGENRIALADLAEMANKLNSYAKQNNHTEVQKALLTLEKAVPQALINIYAAANKLTQECDECENIVVKDKDDRRNVSEERLKCRIRKMNSGQQANLGIVAKIRKASVTPGPLGKERYKVSTFGYGDLLLDNTSKHSRYAAYSGDDRVFNDEELVENFNKHKHLSSLRPWTIAHEFKTLQSIGALSDNYSSALFFTLKTINGRSVQNDAEIKIMETAQNKLFKENMSLVPVTLTIFSDRVTCAYCQEVAFRATQIQNSKYLFYPGHITTPIKLRLDGGPYYEQENVDHDLVLRVLGQVN